MASNTNYFTQEKDNLFSTVLSELKALGVKVPKIKKFKSIISKQEIAVSEKSCKIFGVSLSEQEWTSEVEYPIPKFISWATTYLQKFIEKEIGLFRKAGNRARQRNLRAKLEKGERFQDADPNDVACLLKQWLRELPEPLIPSYLQDLFIRCNCLDVKTDRVAACLFAVLLLPPEHMYTLKHILRFLSSISINSDKNKMGIDNLAIIMAPNIFMANESAEKMNNLLNDYTAIIKIMIENSDKIGDSPPSIFRRTLLGADLHASTDTLDVGPSKYKRKMSGPVQDILHGFKKLVGHNGSWKSSCEDNIMGTPKVPRQSLSLVNLDSPDFVTPKEKEETVREEKKSGAHARRKSFGALLLRKKDRKRPENDIHLSVPDVNAKKLESEKDLPLCENSKNIVVLTDNSSNFSSLNLNSSFNKKEKDNSFSLRNSKEAKSIQLRDTRDDSVIKVLPVDKPVVKYSKSCKLQVENESEVFKTPLPPKIRYSTLKSEKKKDKSLGKFGLSRQEAFSFKPNKQKSQSKSENKNTDKENVQVKTTDSVKSLNYTCSHSQKSACNTKCDKNKSGNCERKISEKRAKQESCSRNQSQKNKNTETILLKSRKVSSRAAPATATSSSISETSSLIGVSENKGPQSLDLSLKLLVQNFCMSPPNGSSEIKLSIDIEASNSNPELKLNISQKETQQNSSSTCKTHQISENSATKTRARLSSQSDSKIPRLKNLHRPSRPSSFSGTVTESSRRTRRLNEKSKRHSTKTPITENACDPAKESVEIQSGSCFVSPYSTSESWVDGASKYWSPPTSPLEDIFNKRESVAKIFKENPGHVKAKVNLYNSKNSDSSDSSTTIRNETFESIKITRASSEKYPRNYWNNKPKLCTSKSCSSNRITPLRSKSHSERSLFPDLSKSAHKEMNISSSKINLLNDEKQNNSADNVFT